MMKLSKSTHKKSPAHPLTDSQNLQINRQSIASDKQFRNPNLDKLFASGGEMGKCVRTTDWSKTSLGPIEKWPQSLLTTVSLALASNFPISIAWGPQRIQIYNDGYWPICGDKHPRSMGQDFKECWFSAWPAIGEAFESASKGETRFLTNQRMFLDRYGYLEETFFTFSFSPIRDESGEVVGLFHPVTELTQQTLAERRLKILRDLADRTGDARTVHEASSMVIETLTKYELDLPFVLLYLLNTNGTQATLSESTGLGVGTKLSPKIVALKAESKQFWPLTKAASLGKTIVVNDREGQFGSHTLGPYPEPPKKALVMPITLPGLKHPFGILVAGVSARRELDEVYRTFYDLLLEAVTNAITNARSYEEERKRAEALAELDRAKTLFFSNISHEFRTPLTLMIGPLEDALLDRKNQLPNQQKERITLIHRNSLRLQRLVNALLEFSRIEAGRIKAFYQPTDLSLYTRELASAFQSAMEKAGLKFIVDCKPLKDEIYVDHGMWEKIVLNLLSNALKFTFKGKITILLKEKKGEVLLEVSDTGIGVSQKEIPNLFKRFYRIKDAKSRTHEGSGIGLALVQELVKLHGGTIQAESTLGKGTTFTVRIPTGFSHLPKAQVVTEQKRVKSTPIGPGSTFFVEEAQQWLQDTESPQAIDDSPDDMTELHDTSEKALLLIVDDNTDMRAYIRRILSKNRNWQIETANNGMQALQIVKKQPPDLILTDIMMPEMDGFELVQKLRHDSKYKRIPIIFLSARAGEEAKVEGLEAGADDYLIKPFSARELFARVKTHLELAHARQDVTILKKAEEHLQQAINLRDNFISMASHELKTPVTTLKAFTQTLHKQAKKKGSSKDSAYLSKMNDQLDRLTHLIYDMLDISKVTNGRLELHKKKIAIDDLVKETVESLRVIDKKHKIVVDGQTKKQVFADPERTRQVLTNLILNATKYSPRSHKIIVKSKTASDSVVISVQDFGIGLQKEYHDKIFERFFRVFDGEDKKFPGLGMGLYITSEIVKRHGGDIWVESDGKHGSTFSFTLPLRVNNVGKADGDAIDLLSEVD